VLSTVIMLFTRSRNVLPVPLPAAQVAPPMVGAPVTLPLSMQPPGGYQPVQPVQPGGYAGVQPVQPGGYAGAGPGYPPPGDMGSYAPRQQ
jgi:hypothetical protein